RHGTIWRPRRLRSSRSTALDRLATPATPRRPPTRLLRPGRGQRHTVRRPSPRRPDQGPNLGPTPPKLAAEHTLNRSRPHRSPSNWPPYWTEAGTRARIAWSNIFPTPPQR